MLKKLLERLRNGAEGTCKGYLDDIKQIAQCKEEAENYFDLIKQKNNFELSELQRYYSELSLNLNAKSLQEFEQLYFDIYKNKLYHYHLSRPQFEGLLSFYLQKLFVENNTASWEVAIVDDNTYALGIRFEYGAWSNNCYAKNLIEKSEFAPNNLYQYFMEFVPDDLKDLI